MLAGLIAPLAAALLVTALYIYRPLFGPGAAAAVSILAYQFGVAAEVIVGVPLLLVTARLRPIRWWTCFSTGALAGLGASLLTHKGHIYDAGETSTWAVIGAVAGLTFWGVYTVKSRRGTTAR